MTDPLADALCPDCGYSLRALTGPRCPECGLDLAPLRIPESRIPWVHRRRRGRIRAFYQTVYFVMFGYRMFRAEMVRPVSLRDAQRFRWTVVVQAWLTLLALWPAWRWVHPKSFLDLVGHHPVFLDWPFLLGAPCVLLWLAALTGIHTYFFHPRWMPVVLQDRAVALSYYMCAPLALLPPLALLVVSATWILLRYRFDMPELLATFLPCLVLAVLVPWGFDVLRLASVVLRQPLRTWTVAIAVPLAGLVLTVLILAVLPVTVLYAITLVRLVM